MRVGALRSKSIDHKHGNKNEMPIFSRQGVMGESAGLQLSIFMLRTELRGRARVVTEWKREDMSLPRKGVRIVKCGDTEDAFLSCPCFPAEIKPSSTIFDAGYAYFCDMRGCFLFLQTNYKKSNGRQ